MTDKMREEFELIVRGYVFQSGIIKEKDIPDIIDELVQAARTVPDGFVLVSIDTLNSIGSDLENAQDWMSAAQSHVRNLLPAAPEGEK